MLQPAHRCYTDAAAAACTDARWSLHTDATATACTQMQWLRRAHRCAACLSCRDRCGPCMLVAAIDNRLDGSSDVLLPGSCRHRLGLTSTSVGMNMCWHQLLLASSIVGRYDHQERLTAREALAHPYFAPIRQMKERGAALTRPSLDVGLSSYLPTLLVGHPYYQH